MLDDPAVRQVLWNLWQQSNADAPQTQRLEQAAWIVLNADGSLGMAPFTDLTEQGPCAVNGNMLAPANAVAWVHTHPFRRGEELVVCGAYKRLDPAGNWIDVIGPDGRPDYPEYDNRPSADDRAVLEAINDFRKQHNLDLLSGVIIDHDRTTAFTEDAAEQPRPFPRCGY